jgi:hypothetical protein
VEALRIEDLSATKDGSIREALKLLPQPQNKSEEKQWDSQEGSDDLIKDCSSLTWVLMRMTELRGSEVNTKLELAKAIYGRK